MVKSIRLQYVHSTYRRRMEKLRTGMDALLQITDADTKQTETEAVLALPGHQLDLVRVVGTNQRRRRDEQLKCRITFQERLLQPRELFGSPQGLVGAIGQAIGAAVIASFDEPDL